LPRLEVQTATFVLPATPVAPLGRTHEENFVLRQVSLAAGAAATVCVAINGAPVFSETFVWLIFPASISSTSEPMSAEVMSFLSFIAAGLTAAFGSSALYPTGFAWLIIAMSKAFSP
jgi:hypothetical protein